MEYTIANLIKAINGLDRNVIYDYPSKQTKTRIKIIDVTFPEGPILIERITLDRRTQQNKHDRTSLSVDMLQRLAYEIKPNHPINIDRVFGASYNTRSALETLLLHTEYFYICYPGRIQNVGQRLETKKGHKHIVYCPEKPHKKGVIEELNLDGVCIIESERSIQFDALVSNKPPLSGEEGERQREHEQMQTLLVLCAEAMGLKSWVARNDHGVKYNNKPLIEMDCVIKKLEDATPLKSYPKAAKAGELIDCIWFDDSGYYIPAIIEIEHSTGVTSGLTRMKSFRDLAPRLEHMTYIIAAPDDKYRKKILQKANEPQFKELNVKYLPYSAIIDLYQLTRRPLHGIDNIKFLHTFLEDATI